MFTRTLSIVGLVGAFAAPALAQAPDDVPPVTDAPDGRFAVPRGVQGPAGMFSARLMLDINASSGAFGEPVSIIPDLFYSLSDKAQIGLVHSGPLGWQTPAGPGLCLTGKDHGCAHVYDNLGADLMYGLLFGKTHLSAHGTFFVDSIDAGFLHLAVGVMGKLHFSERAALVFDPKIAIALTDRDTVDDVLYVPVELEYQANPQTVLKLLTGIYGGLDSFGDTYVVPLGVGAQYNINKRFDIGGRFSFDNLIGNHAEGVGAADARSILLLLNVRS